MLEGRGFRPRGFDERMQPTSLRLRRHDLLEQEVQALIKFCV
jgi:hypothetical protein